MRIAIAICAATVLITEGLSVFGLVGRWPVAIVWLGMVAGFLFAVRKRIRRPRLAWPGLDGLFLCAAIAVIVLVIGFTALVSPPNSADAMAYHLPRVVYWTQAGSVAFFPTSYLNQVMLQPMAEYLVLQTYVLSGGDRFANLIQFGAMVASLFGVSLITRQLGGSPRAQIMAAVFCATLPNGILQASGAKNDYVLAFAMVAAVYFGLREEAAWFSVAVAIALFTKGTAYLFLPAVLIMVAGVWLRRAVLPLLLAVLVVNGPLYWRNLEMSRSPVGYDSAQGDGEFRWPNEHFGVRVTLSNLMRHSAEQLPARDEAWNRGLYDAVLTAHRWIGADPDDPASTWPYTHFEAPRNANHEANAANKWHFIFVVFAAIPLLVLRDRRLLLYYGGIVIGFVLFCAYLKWQLFMARLLLPLFVLSAPLFGLLLERLRSRWLAFILCLFLLDGSRRYLIENWTRPLTGPHSLFTTSREQNYFRDMGQWNNQQRYFEAAEAIQQSGCRRIGIDNRHYTLEYPLEALLLERDRGYWFKHVEVSNASSRFGDTSRRDVCAVVCLGCTGDWVSFSPTPTSPPSQQNK